MKILKYFFEYLFIQTLLILFKIIGYENASNFGEIVGKRLGPFFRKTETILKNIERANITSSINYKKLIIKNMWGNYGRILSEYPYMKKFKSNDFNKYIQIEGKEYLEEIKKNKKRVVFISGHFNNFELMAMQIEKAGIELAAIYRPLNNIFLNKIMEKIRINYICKNQIPKGKVGSRKLLEYFKNGNSIALMIDQRVSEGIKVNFFGELAATTSIPAQLAKKYNCEVVPIYIERFNKFYFKMTVNKPIAFKEADSIESISLTLNKILEKMILKKPDQWIWSHNRWK